MLTSTAMKAGFSGGLVVDFPHSTRAKKYFLVLMVGSSSYQPQAQGVEGEESEEEAQITVQQRSHKRRKTANGNIQVHLGIGMPCMCTHTEVTAKNTASLCAGFLPPS